MKETTGIEPIVIPEIYCPFPSQMSPHYTAVKAHTLDWMQRLDLVQHEVALSYYHMADLPGLACRVYPSADLAELCLASDWLYFICVFAEDGLAKREQDMLALHEHLLAVIQHPPLAMPQGPIAEAFADLCLRAGSSVSSAWRKRFALHNAENFAAQRWQVARSEQQSTPDVQAYLAKYTLLPVFDLIEVVQHTEIPPEIYASQSIQAILQAGNNIVSWTNDVHTLQRNIACSDVNSVLTVVSKEQNISLQKSIKYVCAMINAETQRFEEILRHLPASAVDCNRYVGPLWIGVADWLRGHLDWSRGNKRSMQEMWHGAIKGKQHLVELLSL